MVARSVAHIVEIIVLAARADAFLRCNGPVIGAGFNTRKHVLELHHPRIGEQQCRIVSWNERT